ncbi:hypothetical protein, partial [Terriglobus sp. ADX1]|uniref:hypothetical protein n=1 Tax=Terriglobus sp. ADX1 TaxID=2794063 RepID=UPI003FCD8C64
MSGRLRTSVLLSETRQSHAARGRGSVMVADKKGGAPEPYITLNTAEALAGLAQMSVLEIHPWGSR